MHRVLTGAIQTIMATGEYELAEISSIHIRHQGPKHRMRSFGLEWTSYVVTST